MKTFITESKLPVASNSSPIAEARPNEADDFELPEQPSFDSRPPRLSFEHAFALSEESLAWARAKPGFEEERLRTKCRAEFIM
jgi:hypothetical protein